MKDIRERKRLIRVYRYDDFLNKNAIMKQQELDNFKCERLPSLQKFLSKGVSTSCKPYIVYDIKEKQIVAFFTLISSCMVEMEESEKSPSMGGASFLEQEKDVLKILPSVELEHFGLNDKYLDSMERKGYNNKGIGKFVFEQYISKVIVSLSSDINFTYVILHAYNHPKVIEAYHGMGFETFEDDATNIFPVMKNVVSLRNSYSNTCKFMYQELESIVVKVWKEA